MEGWPPEPPSPPPTIPRPQSPDGQPLCCKRCFFYEAYVLHNGTVQPAGFCRRYPPVSMMKQPNPVVVEMEDTSPEGYDPHKEVVERKTTLKSPGQMMSVFPNVNEGQWCGEFRAKGDVIGNPGTGATDAAGGT